MKINRLYFRSLRNNEHFQFHTEFKALVEEYTPGKLKIEALFAAYLPLYDAEDEAIIKIIKSSFVEAREDADLQRDATFRGIADMVKAGINHFDFKIVEANKRLKIVLDTYGNLARLPLQEETSAIYNLVKDLREKYTADIEATGLKPWIDKLDNDNKFYESLVKESYNEAAALTELKAKEARIEIDSVYRQIVELLEALMLIEGDTEYAAFARKLNVQIDKYSNLLAQRQGRAKSKPDTK